MASLEASAKTEAFMKVSTKKAIEMAGDDGFGQVANAGSAGGAVAGSVATVESSIVMALCSKKAGMKQAIKALCKKAQPNMNTGR